MGRKSVYTGDPSDKIDRDVLEAAINLAHDAQSPPIGLRVTVRFYRMVFRNRNHGGRKSWLPTIKPSKTVSNDSEEPQVFMQQSTLLAQEPRYAPLVRGNWARAI